MKNPDIPVIIHLSITKSSLVKNLVKRYREIGFTDFDLLELAQMSRTEWRRHRFPIPNGYTPKKGSILVKIPKNSIYS